MGRRSSGSILRSDVEHRTEITDALLHDIGNDLRDALKKKLEDMDKVVFGLMMDSIVFDEYDKIVGSSRRGISNVEFGREAGSHTPIEELKRWAGKRFQVSESEALGIAIAVEKKIYREGIDETRFMKMTLEEFVR